MPICRAPHAPLYERFDLDKGKHKPVGVPGTYGPVCPETGAEYCALGSHNPRGSTCSYSSDLKVGLFYSDTVFIWGVDQDGVGLPFTEVEKFHRKFYGSAVRRKLLPRGYDRGVATWDRALMYCPPEGQPYWELDGIERRLKQSFQGCEVINSGNPNMIEVSIKV